MVSGNEMNEVSHSKQSETTNPIVWNGQPLFWPKLFRKLGWVAFAAMFGLALLASLSIVHNPLDFGSFDQFCPPDSTDLSRCRKGLYVGALGAILGIGIIVVALIDLLNIALRTLTRRPIESYRLDRAKLHINRYGLIFPTEELVTLFLSFERTGQSVRVVAFNHMGIKRTAILGPFVTNELQALVACLNSVKERP